MAWTSMHFAMGMGCAGALAGTACLIFRRGWRFIPAAMTLGGLWALLPDMPRFFREDFPSLPLAGILGDKSLERLLHSIGDLFFFHQSLDAQPHELALHGLGIILILYNLSIGMLLGLERRQRNSVANRNWRAHRSMRRKHRRRRSSQRHLETTAIYPVAAVNPPPCAEPTVEHNHDPDSPVVAQIKSGGSYHQTG